MGDTVTPASILGTNYSKTKYEKWDSKHISEDKSNYYKNE